MNYYYPGPFIFGGINLRPYITDLILSNHSQGVKEHASSKASIPSSGTVDTDLPEIIWSKVDLYQLYQDDQIKVLKCQSQQRKLRLPSLSFSFSQMMKLRLKEAFTWSLVESVLKSSLQFPTPALFPL